ncbi:hypothetical protein [Streptomyces sp. CFMR 7]|uniref:hypothetical protein n=1 Tax=Streptomyces sp. CFMR 7 TaxID=1649184 RepID=UPI0006AD0C03|nr:hypothetical protein [Streptomyces sp. CFMR 7]ALC28443.1 hypothetical protein ABE83_16005 [Streptomyces sp. CFMR 7]
MPQPPTEPTEPNDETSAFLATCGHTHLFPGARCRLQGLSGPAAFAAAPHPVDLYLRFSDGAATDAKLHTEDPPGPLLTVPAYTTGAGTAIDARTWTVREFTATGEGEVELTIGTRGPDHAPSA